MVRNVSIEWQVYELVYQAISPVSIGFYKLGFIERTRYYIPGLSIWGAITANFTRYLMSNYIDPIEDYYEEIGNNLINKDILFSYFYPSLSDDLSHSFKPLIPKYTDNGLYFGEYPVKRFESLFIRSFEQTAIEPKSNTAEEGSLHEIEFIVSNIEEKNNQKKVYFLGYIFIKNGISYKEKEIGLDNSKDINLINVIKEIFVGKDRGYGFGRLILSSCRRINLDENLFGYYKLDVSSEESIKIKIENNAPIPAHLAFRSDISIKGDVEPLVVRRWEFSKNASRKYGAGQKICNIGVYWVPGSILESKEEITFKISEFGILK